MKALFFTLIFLSASANAASIELPVTTNAHAVQALLAESMVTLEMNGLDPHNELFDRDAEGNYVISDPADQIICSARSRGMLPVQTYHCTLTSDKMEATMYPNTVAAKVNTILNMVRGLGEKAGYIRNLIVAGENGLLTIEDDHHRMTCQSNGPGEVPQRWNSCEVIKK